MAWYMSIQATIFFFFFGGGLLWQNFKVGKRRTCEAPAGKEAYVMVWWVSRERRPCEAPEGKKDPAELVSGGHFVQPGGTILAVLVKRHKWNISVKLFRNRATGRGGDVLLRFYSTFSSSNHFVQQSRTILAMGRKRNISVKLFWNPLATAMSFKGFSILSSGDHFVQQSRTILAILVKGDKIILKSGHWPKRRCRLKLFLF